MTLPIGAALVNCRWPDLAPSTAYRRGCRCRRCVDYRAGAFLLWHGGKDLQDDLKKEAARQLETLERRKDTVTPEEEDQ